MSFLLKLFRSKHKSHFKRSYLDCLPVELNNLLQLYLVAGDITLEIKPLMRDILAIEPRYPNLEIILHNYPGCSYLILERIYIDPFLEFVSNNPLYKDPDLIIEKDKVVQLTIAKTYNKIYLYNQAIFVYSDENLHLIGLALDTETNIKNTAIIFTLEKYKAKVFIEKLRRFINDIDKRSIVSYY